MMHQKIDSLRRAVAYGLENGKKTVIAELDVLAAMFLAMDSKSSTPRGQEFDYTIKSTP